MTLEEIKRIFLEAVDESRFIIAESENHRTVLDQVNKIEKYCTWIKKHISEE